MRFTEGENVRRAKELLDTNGAATPGEVLELCERLKCEKENHE